MKLVQYPTIKMAIKKAGCPALGEVLTRGVIQKLTKGGTARSRERSIRYLGGRASCNDSRAIIRSYPTS